MKTIYNPDVSLFEQVKIVTVIERQLCLFGEPIPIGKISFYEALEVNGQNYVIAMQENLAIKSEIGQATFYKKITYTVKGNQSDYLESDISKNELDEFMKDLYSNTLTSPSSHTATMNP